MGRWRSNLAPSLCAAMTRNWKSRRSASTVPQETISLIIAGSGVQSMPGYARRHLLGLCTLPQLPSRASASTRETRDRVQGIGRSDRHRAGPAADATPALRAVALRPGRQDHGSVAVELGAVALRRRDEKLEHATISIHSPPRDDQPHHCWFRCAIDARHHLLGLCTLPQLPSRASASSARPGIASKELGTRIATAQDRCRRDPGSPRRRAAAGEARSWVGGSLNLAHVACAAMTRNWNIATISIRSPKRRSASPFLVPGAIDAGLMPGTTYLDCAHSLNCLPGRARVALRPGIASRELGARIATAQDRCRRGPGSPRCRAAAGEARSWVGGRHLAPSLCPPDEKLEIATPRPVSNRCQAPSAWSSPLNLPSPSASANLRPVDARSPPRRTTATRPRQASALSAAADWQISRRCRKPRGPDRD